MPAPFRLLILLSWFCPLSQASVRVRNPIEQPCHSRQKENLQRGLQRIGQ